MEKRKIKVLHAITSINNGGAENYLVNELQSEIWKDFDVSVIYFAGNGYHAKLLLNVGVKVIFLDRRDFLFWFKLLVICFRRFDIIHAHLPFSEVASIWVSLFDWRVKFIFTRHNDRKFTFLPFWLERSLWGLFEKRCHLIVCISDAVKEFFRLNNGVVIPYGIKKLRHRPRAKSGRELIVGMAGRFVPQKRYDLALEVWRASVVTMPAVSFVVAGSGDLFADIETSIKSQDLNANVRLLGQVNNMAEFYSSIDLFMLTSENEGFGRVVIEAMAWGVPVVAFDVSSLRYIVTDACGIFIPFGDTEKMSETLTCFLGSEGDNVFAQMSQNCIDRIDSDFSPEQQSYLLVNQYLSLYSKCK